MTERLFGLKKMIATLGYAGYAPIAPGTAGSAVALIFYYFFCVSLGPVGWAVVLLVVSGVGVYTAAAMAREWGKDPGPVVIDEGVGFLFTVAWLPHSAWMAFVGFLLFRLLDILKPAPVRQCEKLPGGWGIMADDVVAGLCGNLFLRVGLYFLD